MKKIKFYYLVPNKYATKVVYNEGLAVLIAIAKRNQFHTTLQVIDLSEFKRGVVIDQDAEYHAISFSSLQFPLAEMLIRLISNKEIKGKVIVGGVHATVDYESILKIPGVDMVVAGEGENVIEWCLKYPDTPLAQCPFQNIYIKGLEGKPLEKEIYVNLNNLPFPDRVSFDIQAIRERPEFILSRGCPFSCSYCANEFLNLNYGNKIRKKSPDYAIAEIDDAFTKLDISRDTVLTFHDDIFILDKEWLSEFGRKYKKHFRNPFRCNTIASAVTYEKARLLKEMNCTEVWIAIENGDENYRKKVLRKNVSNKMIISSFETVRQHSMKTVSFNMFGCPGETTKEIKATFRLNRLCKVDEPKVNFFIPYPGTSLYNQELIKNNVKKLTPEMADLKIGVLGLKNKPVGDAKYRLYALLFRFYVKEKWFFYYTILFSGLFQLHRLILPLIRIIKRTFLR